MNEFSSETSNSLQRIYTKMERCHFSHLNETTEDGVSIWVHPSLHNKVSTALYLNMQNKTSDSKSKTTKRIWKCPRNLCYEQNLSVYNHLA